MNKENLKAVVFIFLLTLTVGFGYLKFGVAFPISSDAVRYYDPIALNLVEGKGFTVGETPTAQIAPGYPSFLALIYTLFGHDYDFVRILQLLLLAGTGIIVYFMAQKYLKLSPALSFLASATTVVWPYLIIYSTLILTEILFIFLFLFSVYFLIRSLEEKTFKTTIISGVILGMAILTRPVILLLPVWLCLFFFIALKFRKKAGEWKKIGVFLLLAIVVILPWTLRNFLQFDSFIPVSGGLDSALNKSFVTYDYTQGSVSLKPGETNLQTAILFKLKNVYLFWNPGAEGERAQVLTKNYSWANNLILYYKVLFFFILGLAFLSLKFIKQKEIFLIWTIIIYFWALHVVLFPYPRYTLPVIPLVILLAFFTLNNFRSFLKIRIQKSF